MNINYIILAHKNPIQVKRLVYRLNEEWVSFYIHIDVNFNIDDYKSELDQVNNVTFLEGEEREKGTWGDIGIVRATINAMKLIKNNNRNGYTVLLSGQDYPLQGNLNILNFLKNNPEFGYINLFSLPHQGWHMEGLNRINRYKINKSERRGHFLQLTSIFEEDFYSLKTFGHLNFLRKAGKFKKAKLIFKKRRFPKYLKPYGGGQWWALPFGMLEYILAFLDQYPNYLNYHVYTLLPDEIFFHSILGSSKFSDKIQPAITFVNWEREQGPLPVTFTKSDFSELINQSNKKLFARKFDIDLDQEILDLIDENLQS
ncbi:beta-1,6-N-acetylglucosaminyltransferase [Antarcticibacterium arcticum]|uniref:Peptide O-xylosyltransferase n=1 Tax=Antarcticibacterium arcticum TaxID=2585771 RepID=A0A5B8YIJ9_9FLAO|nr:beta-1,6-N-acetylglucosaminyltransferase [Antarcticibacterium arcticum]QED37762.1 beta-1,6-N-acetylglucosaminyltransferase [Antarcticibacterium arcticum]